MYLPCGHTPWGWYPHWFDCNRLHFYTFRPIYRFMSIMLSDQMLHISSVRLHIVWIHVVWCITSYISVWNPDEAWIIVTRIQIIIAKNWLSYSTIWMQLLVELPVNTTGIFWDNHVTQHKRYHDTFRNHGNN